MKLIQEISLDTCSVLLCKLQILSSNHNFHKKLDWGSLKVCPLPPHSPPSAAPFTLGSVCNGRVFYM